MNHIEASSQNGLALFVYPFSTTPHKKAPNHHPPARHRRKPRSYPLAAPAHKPCARRPYHHADTAADNGCEDRMETEKKQPETGAGTADSRLNARRTGKVTQTVGSERRTGERRHGSFAPDERGGQRRRTPEH